MNGIEAIDWATLPPMALMTLAMSIGVVIVWRMMLVTKDMQKNALESGTTAVAASLNAFKDTMSEIRETARRDSVETRTFYTTKLEDMRAGVRLVEDRVADLEKQLEDRDRRIAELERINERVERENKELRDRVAELEKLNAKPKAARKNAKKPISAGAGL